MALVNPIVYRLPFRRNWIYRDNLFFSPALYSSVTGGAYFLPYVFKRLFEQRQFRDIETYFSHCLVKRFNNNTLHYQFFIQSRFFIKAREVFQNEFFPHIFRNKRMSEGRGGIFKNYQLLALLRKKERKVKKINRKLLLQKGVGLNNNSVMGNKKLRSSINIVRRTNSLKPVSKRIVKQGGVKTSRPFLPSDRVIQGLYNKLLVETGTVPFKLNKVGLIKHIELLNKLKKDIDKSRLIRGTIENKNLSGENKKQVQLVSYFNKKTMPLGVRLRRKFNVNFYKRKQLLRLDKQRLIAFQVLLRFFEYYTRVFVFNHYKAAILKTLSSYFQNQKFRYVIDFRFLSLRAQNIYQMLRFMTSRLTQGGNIKQLIRSTQRFYETRGSRNGMSGVKLVCSGRFSRQQRAQRLILTSGKVPSNTISAKIDYAISTLRLKYGTSTIKMWLSYE